MAKFLPEICKIQYGFPFDSKKFSLTEGIPLIRIRDITRGYSETYTTQEYDEDFLVYENDLLIGMDGEFNIAKWGKTPALLNQRVCRLIPSDQVEKNYLFYYMPSALKRIEEKTPFVTVKHLSAKELNKIQVPLPPISEQRRIASILDKVTDLIVKRRAQLEKLDLLVKSRFVEMFENEDHPYQSLENLIIDGAGLSYGIVQPGNDGTGDMGVIRPVDLVSGQISMQSVKYIDRAIGNNFRKTELNGKELLITVRGTTGITALTDERCKGMNVTRGIAVIRYDCNKINPIYLNAYLNAEKCQEYIQKHTKGATLQQINLSDLRMLQVSVPKMKQQKQLEIFIKQVNSLKQVLSQSLETLETLKKALMQEYFG